MALFFFTNGTANTPVNKNKNSYLSSNPAIRHLDLSVATINRESLKETASNNSERQYQQAPLFRKKAAVASPSQKESYIDAGAADSLENRRRLKASHVMSAPVVTALVHDLVQHAKKLMLDYDISHIVIVNDQQNPLGLVTAKQLLEIEAPQTSFIQSILDPNVLAVSKDTLVRDIALSFMKYKATAISVVDENHKLIGIISRSDLMSLLVSSPNQQIRA